MTSRGTYSFQQQISVLAIMAPKDVGVLRVLLALIVCCCSIIAGSAVNMPSAELAVCADCWSKEALGPVKEGEGGHPQVTCEAVLAQAYWAELKLTDQLLHPERLCLAVEFPAGEPMGSQVRGPAGESAGAPGQCGQRGHHLRLRPSQPAGDVAGQRVRVLPARPSLGGKQRGAPGHLGRQGPPQKGGHHGGSQSQGCERHHRRHCPAYQATRQGHLQGPFSPLINSPRGSM
ncbi:hypothetical protein L7F22_058486 [Adiantum nelumboides]|nr:hypothetical protein [Adiantum nelumboides]